MMRFRSAVLAALVLVSCTPGLCQQPSSPPTPESFFGFEPGSDRNLLDYEQQIAYLLELDEASARLRMDEVGTSPLGKPMHAVFISTAENIASLERLGEINRRLALDPEIPDAERNQLLEDGRVFVMFTLSIHATEVAPAQMFPVFAHDMVTTTDEDVLEQLSQVVLMVVPSQNPDGMDMVVNHYREHLGTQYEGSSLPRVYNRYVGHDNNRDFVTLSQDDVRVVATLYSRQWYPQVLVDKHQMGRTGPRYFVPANHDPIAENVDEGLWNWATLLGAALATDMATDGHQGVATHWLFDNYWPGCTETSQWKNIISLLTEAASCKVASPVFVEPTELSVRGKGLSEYKKSVNMPDPWPGGWWRLSDIVAYELSSMRSLLKNAAYHREDILRLRNQLCREQVQMGKEEPPYAYVLPLEQHDRGALVDIVRLLHAHGVQVYELATKTEVGGSMLEPGDIVVPLAQPYRAFVKEILERQRFPVRHYTPDGEIIRPYDITSWSLPLHYGVSSIEIDTPWPELASITTEVAEDWAYPGFTSALPEEVWALAYPASDNDSFEAAFLALDKGLQVLRLEEPADAQAATLPAGSFLILAGDRVALTEVADTVGVPPAVFDSKPEAATRALTVPRIALVETHFHDMDAGWTRYVFDRYHIPFQVVRPGEIENLDLAADFDVMVFPDAGKDILMRGKRKRGDRYMANDFPPEFRKGIGDDGMKKLVGFLDAGGIVVSWRRSAELFLDGFGSKDKYKDGGAIDLPARDVSESLEKKGLYVPGSFLQVQVLQDHPLTRGMPERTGIFSRGAPVFSTSIPMLDTDRRVIAVHPEEEILLSGYAEHEERLANRPVMVWLRRGAGQLVLYGFNPQFRASTPATYKLLFNALLLPRIEKDVERYSRLSGAVTPRDERVALWPPTPSSTPWPRATRRSLR